MVGNLSLVFATFCLALAVGGGIYEGLIVNPQWSINPPSSFSLVQEKTGIPLQKFWIPAHILITLFIVAALFLNWRSPARRNFIIVAVISYIVMRVWSFIYFIPEMLSFQKVAIDSPPTDQLLERVERWNALTWWRLPLDLVSFFCLIWALTIESD